MTTFGWKKKIGEKIDKDAKSKFSIENENEVSFKNFKWVDSFRRKKIALDLSNEVKSEEFKTKGLKLAELNRFKDAVVEWDKALDLTPNDEKLLEMKAQALLSLNKPFPALQAAERAIKINPHWWVAYQTLGRTQLGIGDLKMAKASFCKAIHINPTEKELWDEDLNWTVKLISQKRQESLQTNNSINISHSDLDNSYNVYSEKQCHYISHDTAME